MSAIDASLRRLQIDHVDLYQLHSDDRKTLLDETIEAMNTIVGSSRARCIGVSNFLAYRLARALGRTDCVRLTLRVGTAALQPAVSRNRARDARPEVNTR